MVSLQGNFKQVAGKSLFLVMLFSLIAYSISYLYNSVQNKTYHIAYTESVSGLQVGSPVEMNGVVVGKVTEIENNETQSNLVDVLIQVKRKVLVTQGAVASLVDRDSTWVALRDEGRDQHPLMSRAGEQYPLIPAKPSLQARKEIALAQISQSLQQLNETVQLFLDKDNIESLKQLLYSMQEVMGVMAADSQRIHTLIVNTEAASYRFNTILSTSDRVLSILQSQTLPATYRLMSNLETVSIKSNELIDEMTNQPSMLLRGKAQAALGPGEGK